jgi:hypothetical protein
MSKIFGRESELIRLLSQKDIKYPTVIIDALTQLSQTLLTLLKRIGTHDASGGTAPSSTADAGDYWVITGSGVIDTIHYYVNDWIIWNGSTWEKRNNQGDEAAVISDVPYNEGTWNADSEAATKNVLRDEFERHYGEENEHHTKIDASNDAFDGSWEDNLDPATKNMIHNIYAGLYADLQALDADVAAVEGIADTPAGSLKPWSTNTPPSGWLVCDGSAILRDSYPDLFDAIGVSFGVADGSRFFKIPDFRGQFLRGRDNGAGVDADAATRLPFSSGTAYGPTCSCTTGSPTITGLTGSEDDSTGIGQLVVYAATIPNYSRVIAENDVAGTVTLDKNATGNATDVVMLFYPCLAGTMANGVSLITGVSDADMKNICLGMTIEHYVAGGDPKYLTSCIITDFDVDANTITVSGTSSGVITGGLFQLGFYATGDNIGSYQANAMRQHQHDYTYESITINTNTGTYGGVHNRNQNNTTSGQTDLSAEETRPLNAYINWIIKY